MTIQPRNSLFQVFIGEPLSLATAQPHQVLLSTGSVAIMAQYAAHSGIVDPIVGYCIAAGVEWAYLRGLASDSRAASWWGAALNWSAFGIVVLWGVLWVATLYQVLPPQPAGIGAWLLAASHIVPIAWLSLCSAMCHRAALAADHARLAEVDRAKADREARIEAERDRIQLEIERKQAELGLWEAGQAAKMRAQDARTKMRRDARPERAHAIEKTCPKCGRKLEQAQWLAARRWGHCAECKEVQ